MVSTAPTCAVCGATINGRPILVRGIDETGGYQDPACSLACASVLASPPEEPGPEQD